MNRSEIIEAMARAMEPAAWEPSFRIWGASQRKTCEHHAVHALAALEAAIPGLADVLDGKATIVPNEATAKMNGHGETVLMDYLTKRREFMSVSDIYTAMLAATPYRRPNDDRE